MKQKVALVLSGGGARGMAHIGVIEELIERGYEITSIAGTSMGSVIGGVYAMGKMQEYKEWMYTLDRRKVLGLIDFTLSTDGLIKGNKVFKAMQKFIPDQNIEDLNIPFCAIAVDLVRKNEVVINEGSVYEAMRASVSIPNVFIPVKKGDSLLVDGGVLNNIPLNRVQRTEGDILVAVNVNADVPAVKLKPWSSDDHEDVKTYTKRFKQIQNYLQKYYPRHKEDRVGYFNLMNRTFTLMTQQLAKNSLSKYDPNIIINISHDTCGIFDFYKSKEIVETGRHFAKEVLEQLAV